MNRHQNELDFLVYNLNNNDVKVLFTEKDKCF